MKLNDWDPFKANDRFYCRLFIISVLLVVIGAFLSFCSTLSTIVIGIGSGGLASVVVAWLIERETCRKNKHDNMLKSTLIFNDYLHHLSRIRYTLSFYASGCNKTVSKTTKEWLNTLLYVPFQEDMSLLEKRTKNYLMLINHVNLLHKDVQIVRSQYPTLVAEFMESSQGELSEFLSDVDTICEEIAYHECKVSNITDCESICELLDLLEEKTAEYFKIEKIREPYSYKNSKVCFGLCNTDK